MLLGRVGLTMLLRRVRLVLAMLLAVLLGGVGLRVLLRVRLVLGVLAVLLLVRLVLLAVLGVLVVLRVRSAVRPVLRGEVCVGRAVAAVRRWV